MSTNLSGEVVLTELLRCRGDSVSRYHRIGSTQAGSEWRQSRGIVEAPSCEVVELGLSFVGPPVTVDIDIDEFIITR